MDTDSLRKFLDTVASEFNLKGELVASVMQDTFSYYPDPIVFTREEIYRPESMRETVIKKVCDHFYNSPAFKRKEIEIERLKAENEANKETWEKERQELMKYKNYVDIAKELK